MVYGVSNMITVNIRKIIGYDKDGKPITVEDYIEVPDDYFED